jgi:hypothetical protein
MATMARLYGIWICPGWREFIFPQLIFRTFFAEFYVLERFSRNSFKNKFFRKRERKIILINEIPLFGGYIVL